MKKDLDVLRVVNSTLPDREVGTKPEPKWPELSWWCRTFHKKYHVIVGHNHSKPIVVCGWCGSKYDHWKSGGY